ASATPVTFPVPTRDAALMVKAWNGETPSLLSFFSTIRRNISLNKRTCTNLVRTVKYTPKTSNTAINIYVHKKLFNGPTSQFKKSITITFNPFNFMLYRFIYFTNLYIKLQSFC